MEKVTGRLKTSPEAHGKGYRQAEEDVHRYRSLGKAFHTDIEESTGAVLRSFLQRETTRPRDHPATPLDV
jgi:hypothetical protein